MDKIKFGIIGTGKIGVRHAEQANKYGILSSVCDINYSLAEEIGSKYKCKAYKSIEELIEKEKEIDVVAVCTPNGLHPLHSILALQAGKHVLCEKPMAIKSIDAENMIITAEKMNKRLFVVKQNRFNPPVRILKELIEQDKLGRIFSFQVNCFWNRNRKYYESSDWRGTRDLDGGTLFTQFSHFVDLIYWLLGDVSEVKAFGNNFNHKGLIDFEDTGIAILKLNNGIIGSLNYTVNSYNKNFEGSVTVFSENGTIKIGGQYLNLIEYINVKDFSAPEIETSGPANEYGEYQGSMSNHDKVYENLVEVLQNGGSIMTNALEGLKTVQIIENICKQINNE